MADTRIKLANLSCILYVVRDRHGQWYICGDEENLPKYIPGMKYGFYRFQPVSFYVWGGDASHLMN